MWRVILGIIGWFWLGLLILYTGWAMGTDNFTAATPFVSIVLAAPGFIVILWAHQRGMFRRQPDRVVSITEQGAIDILISWLNRRLEDIKYGEVTRYFDTRQFTYSARIENVDGEETWLVTLVGW